MDTAPELTIDSTSRAFTCGVAVTQDIEGKEWETFEDLFAMPTMPFTQILVELHVGTLPERWGTGLHDRLRHASAPGRCHVPREGPSTSGATHRYMHTARIAWSWLRSSLASTCPRKASSRPHASCDVCCSCGPHRASRKQLQT